MTVLHTTTLPIKSLNDSGRVGGYLVVWGSPEQRDLQGEYFTPETEFALDWYEKRPALYQHGMDGTLKTAVAGVIDTIKADDVGLWAEAQLDLRSKYVQAMRDLIEQKALGWSSGSLGHLVEYGEDGRIKCWPIVEGSMTPTPAEPRMTDINAIKSAYDALGLDASKLLLNAAPREAETPRGDAQPDTADGIAAPNLSQSTPHKRAIKMEMSDVEKLINDRLEELRRVLLEEVAGMGGKMDMAQVDEEIKAEVMAEVEDEDTMKTLTAEQLSELVETKASAVIEKAVKSQLEKEAKARAKIKGAFTNGKRAFEAAQEGQSKVGGFQSNGHNENGTPRIQVSEPVKYMHLSADDMAVGALMITANAKAAGIPVRLEQMLSEDYMRVMAKKVSEKIHDSSGATGNSQVNAALKSAFPLKSNELDASNIATQGQEWVGTYWESTIWERARNIRMYQELVRKGVMEKEIPRGYSTAEFPTEGADPIAYTASQANDVDATGRPEVTANISPFKTGKVTLTPGEIKIATAYTVILEEDSIIDVAPQVNYQLTEKMQETIEQLMINGDTATALNTNINLIDGTPATGLSTPYYIATNGFRKLALVTGAATQARDAGGTLSIEDYRETLSLLEFALRSRRERIAFVIDPDTEMASLAIPEIATDDVRRTNATITSGVLTNVYGIDVFTSGFLPLTNTAGMVSGTGSNNTRGTIMALYAPYWGFAFKRQTTIETARDILSGSNIYVASFRMGVVARGTNAAAASYNVGV